MESNRLGFLVTAILVVSLAGTAYAHHGLNAWYDVTKSATVKGIVTSFEWTNPHSYIHADVKSDKGAVENWSAEMGSVAMLARQGWRRDTLKPGDEITLIGRPSKEGKPAMLLGKAVLANGQELLASDILPGTTAGPPREN
jgi:hypothetical protein